MRKRADLFSIWQASKPGVLDVLETYGLRNLSTSSSSRKLLQNLQQAIEKEIPSLPEKLIFPLLQLKKKMKLLLTLKMQMKFYHQLKIQSRCLKSLLLNRLSDPKISEFLTSYYMLFTFP